MWLRRLRWSRDAAGLQGCGVFRFVALAGIAEVRKEGSESNLDAHVGRPGAYKNNGVRIEEA